MSQPKWKKKKVESGSVTEEIIYLSGQMPRGLWTPKSKDEKFNENLRRRVRDLGRTINSNFYAGDYLITLTYNRASYTKIMAAPSIRKRRRQIAYNNAEHELSLFIKRCQYHAEQSGIPFCAIYITSDMRKETCHYVRVHHHMIVNREALSLVKMLWNHGFVREKALRNQADYTPIADYLLEQVCYVENKKSFGRTHNLNKPIETEEVLLDPNETLVEPEGATVLSAGRNYIKYTRL